MTRDGLPQTAFPVRRHSPLGDLSERQTISGADDRRQSAADGASQRQLTPTTFRRMTFPGKAEPRTEASAPQRRERGPEATTRPGASGGERGGEGGIRTRGAFAHRFSRAAPSTTRTPLRGRGYQTRPGRPSTRCGGANKASASSRRMPLDDLGPPRAAMGAGPAG